jgi:radical SAM-linked protein
MVSEVSEKIIDERIPVRIKFSKTGKLKYISHLDLNRTVQKIFVRAQIPIWYTEGFNPIPKIVFASPLSLGSESVCEFMDIKLVSSMDFTEIKERMNATSPAGFAVTDVYAPTSKFTNAVYSAYEIELTAANMTEANIPEITKLFTEPLVLTKRTKSGEKDTDITPFIKKITAEFTGSTLKINATLAADSANYLNPEYLITALKTKTSIFAGDILAERYAITRTKMYNSDGETEFK